MAKVSRYEQLASSLSDQSKLFLFEKTGLHPDLAALDYTGDNFFFRRVVRKYLRRSQQKNTSLEALLKMHHIENRLKAINSMDEPVTITTHPLSEKAGVSARILWQVLSATKEKLSITPLGFIGPLVQDPNKLLPFVGPATLGLYHRIAKDARYLSIRHDPLLTLQQHNFADDVMDKIAKDNPSHLLWKKNPGNFSIDFFPPVFPMSYMKTRSDLNLFPNLDDCVIQSSETALRIGLILFEHSPVHSPERARGAYYLAKGHFYNIISECLVPTRDGTKFNFENLFGIEEFPCAYGTESITDY